jgi:hypothetical protein
VPYQRKVIDYEDYEYQEQVPREVRQV